MSLSPPYLLFLGDVTDPLSIKTARGVAYWRPELCVGEYTLGHLSLGLEPLSPKEAVTRGARAMLLGLSNSGGLIAQSWLPAIREALSCGLNVASGLHQRLEDLPGIRELAQQQGRQLIDVRYPKRNYSVGTGKKRSGKRLLTVGTDCSVGKMYTTLALHREMQQQGMTADFRATGQTGIFIGGEGVPLDAVVADFISGAVEQLSPDNAPDHWDLIEGQSSVFHPSFSGVSLGLLHGAQPDVIVMCHEISRKTMRGLTDYAPPELGACIELNLALGARTNTTVRLGGIALSSAALPPEEAEKVCEQLTEKYGVPCVDPLRHGVKAIVDFVKNL